jgi:hypothetical protein
MVMRFTAALRYAGGRKAQNRRNRNYHSPHHVLPESSFYKQTLEQ